MNATPLIARPAPLGRRALVALLAVAVLAFAGFAAAAPAMAATNGKGPSKSDGDLTPRGDRLAAASPLQRRPAPHKPAHAAVTAGQSRTQLHLKLVEGLHGRVRGGSLASIKDGEDLDAVAAVLRSHRARITPLFTASETTLANEKRNLEHAAGAQLADLNLYFRVTLPKGAPTEQVIDQLNASDLVEIAYAEPKPLRPAMEAMPAPSATPDFSARQGYRQAAPGGIDADHAWTVAGGRGSGVKVIDIEYSWNQTHEDLAAINGKVIPNGTPVDPWNNDNHGTSVMGELFGTQNGFGVTGIVPDAQAGMVNANNTRGYDLANAIWTAQANSAPGDVILLEQQLAGPNWDAATEQEEYAPVEYYQANFDAIARATAAGRIVVEAAGNGYQNLDGAEYARTFDRSYRDSGAILVGAGGGPCGAWRQPARGRLQFSNYGSRVDVQAWGECVTTAGYGDLQSGARNLWYTAQFGGTSSASPIITGAAAILSSIAEQRGLAALTSTQVRTLLQVGATPQTTTGALSGHIGPLPNLRNAIAALGGGGGGTACNDDAMEPNDTMAQATALTSGNPVSGTVCANNDDLFAIDLQAGDELTVGLSFAHASGDLDLSLHDAAGTRLAISETTTDTETITYTATATGTHYLRAFGYQGATNSYRLTATGGGGGVTGCTDDQLETNDGMATATPLAFGTPVQATICPGNIDLFTFELGAGERLIADASFVNAAGDLDISLHDSSGTRIAIAQSTSDDEQLTATVTAGGTYYLMVYGYQSATNAYQLNATRLPAELASVSSLQIRSGLGRASLAWTYPDSGSVAGVDVRVAEGAVAPGPFAGRSVYRGAATAAVATGLTAGRTYTFAVYTLDADGNIGPARSVVTRGSALARSAPSAINKGETARIAGTVTDAASGRALANRKVVLFERPAGATQWRQVTAKWTTSTGGVAFRRTPSSSMAYRLQFAGDGAQLGVTATTVTVRVR
jgi:hypothetical protein